MRRYQVLSAALTFLSLAHLLAASEVPNTQANSSVGFPVPEITPRRTDVAPFTYTEVGKKIPNYTPGEKWGVQGEPHSRMQNPLPAEESIKHFVVPEGFHVELFAAEPDLGGKPLAINWDERGRLWVCESVDYPNELQSPGQGHDRIRICADTNGDGRADKFTVFADKLSIPTSIAFSHGGAIVFGDSQTLYLRDTNGDDVADERHTLFGTWNLRDTHAGPSNMQYGLDNWIWATQGYDDSQLEVGGQHHHFKQGFFRFRPDGSALEFVRSTNNNTWGLGISEEGLIFGSTANHNPSVFMPIANRYYEQVRGWTPSLVLETIADTHLFKPSTDKIRQMDHFGGYTAGAGHALYTARQYPREYWNRTAFVCGPTGHLVGTFVLTPQGADFRSTSPFNLISSDDEWTAPTMAEVGPDGNVWIVDWYNYIVQHNPTPQGFTTGKGQAYETDLRDKSHARVYRVVYGEPNASSKTVSLAGATPAQLVDALSDTNLFWRRHAQRLLVECQQFDVLPDLIRLTEDMTIDEIGLNVGTIHALWTMHGLRALDGSHQLATQAVKKALQHPSAGVRRNAVQVLPRNEETVATIVSAGLLDDPAPQVQLAALLAISEAPAEGTISPKLTTLLNRSPADKWLSDAAICAASANSETFLASLTDVQSPNEGLLRAAEVVAEHRARSGPHKSIAWFVVPLVKLQPQLANAVIQGVARGWPQDETPTLGNNEATLEGLVPQLDLEGRSLLVRLAVRWGSRRFERISTEIASELIRRLQDDGLPPNARMEVATELIALRLYDPDAANAVLESISPRMPPELASEFLQAVGQSRDKSVGTLVTDRLPTLTPAVRTSGVAILLSRPEWTSALVDSLGSGQLHWSDLSLDQQRALAEHPDHEIRNRAQKLLDAGGVLPNPDRRRVLEDLLPLASQTGDATHGKQVFLKQCAKCHVHGSEGTRIGPDLTGMAVHPKSELLENILDPSRSVEGNFRVYTLATTDGQVLTGLLAAESKTAVELYDTEGKKHSVLREDIDQLVASPKSLMPEGFEKQIEPASIVDLLEFLTQRGKYLPIPLAKAANSVTTRGIFQSPNSQIERLVFDDWKPKTFAGVPFVLVDPQGDRVPNAILLHGPKGSLTSNMPKSVSLPCNSPAKAIHFLGGVSGWGFPLGEKGSTSLVVRLHYLGGTTEDHELRNGIHLSDYIRRVDVPESEFAFDLNGRQLRYLAVHPKRTESIERIELLKGPDQTAPVVMAVTVEAPWPHSP